MPSASERMGKTPGGKSDNLLKGSDLTVKEHEIIVVTTGVRTAPQGFNSPFILEIEEVHGKTDWAVNQTNAGALITLVSDDYEKWVGYELKLSKFLTTNPSTKKQAWGLAIVGAKKVGASKRRLGAKKVIVEE
jgi:hypothetical protein